MKYENGMTCPACAKGGLEKIERTLKMHWKDTPMTFPLAKIFQCDVCPEEFFDPETRDMVEMEIKRLKDNETRD